MSRVIEQVSFSFFHCMRQWSPPQPSLHTPHTPRFFCRPKHDALIFIDGRTLVTRRGPSSIEVNSSKAVKILKWGPILNVDVIGLNALSWTGFEILVDGWSGGPQLKAGEGGEKTCKAKSWNVRLYKSKKKKRETIHPIHFQIHQKIRLVCGEYTEEKLETTTWNKEQKVKIL